MAAAKREIYARMATQLLTHERCTIAEIACPGAMGLYLFLVMQARHEKTRGETLTAIATASWGAPTAYRRKQAEALVVAGLVERRDERLIVIRYLDHNDGPEEIEANKAKSRKRYDAWLERQGQTENKRVGPPLSSISGSCSNSNSDLSSEEIQDPPGRTEPRRFDAGTASSERALETFDRACATATGGDFALARAPFHVRDLCLALNKHAPKELATKPDILRWLEAQIAVWIRACDPPIIEPGKLLTWLNNGRKSPAKRVDTRQPLTGPEPEWLKRAKTGTDGTEPF